MTLLESIVDLECCSAHIGYGGVLVIGLGQLVEYDNPKLKNSFHGEWEIRTNRASWRLLKESEIIVGEYDDGSDIKSALQSLVGYKLQNVRTQRLSPDVRLEFNNDTSCEITGTSKEEYAWEVIGPSDNLIILPSGREENINSNFVDSLDPIETTISEHASACAERWSSVVPKKTDNSNCRDCFYYRGLEGQFCFWDYGLCACAKSKFDGKVVNVKSSCEYYESATY